MKKIILLILLCIVTINGFSQCFAPTVALSQRIRASSVVIEGEVIAKNSYWDAKRENIYTINTIKPYVSFKGLTNANSTIKLITLGGTVDLTRDVISGSLELNIGDKGIFLLYRSNVQLSTVSNIFHRFVDGNQGFIKYDTHTRTAHDSEKVYNSIENELYNSIEANIGTKPKKLANDSIFSSKRINSNIQRRALGITNISPTSVNAGVGDIITITGTDFGATQGTINFRDANSGGASWISAYDSDIISWTNTSIQVKVISRASTGTIQVITASAESLQSSQTLTVNWSHLNIPYNLGSGDVNYETSLRAKDTNGGYTFQYAPSFNANTDATSAFESAITSWNCATSVNFEAGTSTSANVDATDGINIVMWQTSAEIQANGGSASTAAYARSRYSGCGSSAGTSWYVREIDIVCNSDINWYYGSGVPSSSQYDFETVLFHELGHAHQLGHVGQTDDVMYYAISNGQQNRNISAQALHGGNYVFNKSATTQVCSQPSMTPVDTEVVINTQPVSYQTCELTGSHSFTINATGAEAYQWQIYNANTDNWEDLVNNSEISGVDTDTFSHNFNERINYGFRCQITNACGDISFSDQVNFSNTKATENVTLNVIPNPCNLEVGSFAITVVHSDGLPTFELSIDGGINYNYTVNTADDFTNITGLSNGSYNIFTRLDATDGCATDHGSFAIDTSQEPAATATIDNIVGVSGCDNSDGQILLSFNDVTSREYIYISLDGGNTYPHYEGLNEGQYLFNDISAGDYSIFVAYNASGLCATDLGTITVGGCDTEPPVAMCQNITITLDETGNATITANEVDGGSTDNVGITTFSLDIDTFTTAELGDNSIILTVADAQGNTDSCSAIVTVVISEEEYFITTWETTTDNESITIPTTGTGYEYIVDWGDGSITNHNDEDASTDAVHSYAIADTYTVKIYGDFPRIIFDGNGDSHKIQTIEQWGAIQWSSFDYAFKGCNNLTINATDAPDLSAATSMQELFRGCTNLMDEDLSLWDVSNIENMRNVFFLATNFNGNISNWNVGNVTDFSGMFADTNFNGNISNWNVGQYVTSSINMINTFKNTSMFNRDLSNWNMSKASNIGGMFDNANQFNQDLGDWDISNVVNMYAMLNGTSLSIENYDATLIGWATLDTDAGETNIPTNSNLGANTSQYCLSETARQELIDSYGWTITDAGNNCENAFVTTWQTTTDNETITIPTIDSGYDYSVDWGDGTLTTHSDADASTDAVHTYAAAGTYTVKITGSFPRIIFDSTGPVNPQKIISVDQWGTIQWSNFEEAFIDCNNLVINATDAPDLSNVTSLESMFDGDIDFNVSLSNWDVSTITNMSTMFRSSHFNGNISAWNVSNVEVFEYMFESVPLFNQDISNWDISNAIEIAGMFTDAVSFDQNLSQWDISNVIDMSDMFAGAGLSIENYDATLIGWATLDTASGETQIPTNITFDGGNSQYCSSENKRQELIDTYSWTITDDGNNCDGAFITTWETITDNETITIPTTGTGYDYSVDWGDGTTTSHSDADTTTDATHNYASAGIYTVKITGDFPRIYFNNSGDKNKIQTIEQWGTIEWTNMDKAFTGCSALTVNTFDEPDLRNVTNLQQMFNGVSTFTGDFNNWDVSTITTLKYLFGFSGFNKDISNWDVSNVTDFSNMFDNAFDFNQDISGWDTSSATNMGSMLARAYAFDQNLGNWDISNVTNMANMFFGTSLSITNYDSTLIGWATLDNGSGETQVPTNITFDGGNSLYCLSETQRQELIDSYDWTIIDAGKECYYITVSPKVVLQGAMLNSIDDLMRTDLRDGDYFSIENPYAEGEFLSKSAYFATGNNAPVDWVWVELRDESDDTLIIDGKSAIIQKDGDVVNPDSEGTPLTFDVAPGNYYISIKHRNHLGIMTNTAIALTTTTTIVDFTDANNPITYGTNAQTTFGMPTDILAMWAGDADGNGAVQYSGSDPDTPSVLSGVLNDSGNFLNLPTYTVSGYNNFDIDINGNAQYSGSAPDTPLILQNVLAHPDNFLGLTTFTITEQIPSEL